MKNSIEEFKNSFFYSKLLKAKERGLFHGCVKIINLNDDLKKTIFDLTSFLDAAYDNVYITQRLYHILNDDYNIHRCNCGNILNFKGIGKTKNGYFASCANSKCKKEKERDTCLKKYGVRSPMQSAVIKDKWKKANLINHGVEYPLQLKTIQDKRNFTRKEKTKNKVLNSMHSSKGEILNIDKKMISYKCNFCNNESYINIQTYYNNRENFCTFCFPLKNFQSSYEKEIRSFLNDHNIEYISNDKKQLGTYELDIFIPSLKLAIEFNGIYWHSDLYKKNKYHYHKYNKCMDKGISLIQIWEDVWIEKKDIFKSIILHKCGKSLKIPARKTLIKEISFNEAKTFCDLHHLHGYVKSTYKIGLFYDNELVSVITFGKRKINKGISKMELLRYCTKKGLTVIGGFSKLLKYAISNFKFDQLITFSYNDLGINTIYEKNGFVKKSESFGYFYTKNYQRLNRINCQKHKLIKLFGFDKCENKTEIQIMKENGFLLCYDSGSTSWIWENKIE